MSALPLHVVSEGDGLPVILLHGFPEFHYSWRNQLPALSGAGMRVLAPDLRGYNLSPKPRAVDSYRMQHLVADIAALAERSGGRCDIVGHDWGGVIAWYLAMSRPELVRRLVVMNIPHPAAFSKVLARSSRQKLRVGYQLFFQLPVLPEIFMKLFGGTLLRRAGRFSADDVAEYRRSWRGAMTTMLNYYRALPRSRAQMRAAIAPLTMPVMLIHGAREPVFLPETFELTREIVPGLRVETIARAGHFVQTDAPERVNELLLDFLLG